MQHHKGTLVIGVASLLLLSVASLASAEPSTASRAMTPMPVALSTLEPGEIEDLATIAQERGISLQESANAVAWQASFSKIVNQIRDRYPADLAGARIERTELGVAWIAFRADAPPPAAQLLTSFSQPVEIREGAGFSEAELDARLTESHFAIQARRELVKAVSSGYDIATGLVTVEIEPTGRVPAGPELRTTLSQSLPANSDGKVQLVFRESVRSGQDSPVYGGDDSSTPGRRTWLAPPAWP